MSLSSSSHIASGMRWTLAPAALRRRRCQQGVKQGVHPPRASRPRPPHMSACTVLPSADTRHRKVEQGGSHRCNRDHLLRTPVTSLHCTVDLFSTHTADAPCFMGAMHRPSAGTGAQGLPSPGMGAHPWTPPPLHLTGRPLLLRGAPAHTTAAPSYICSDDGK